MRHFFILFFPAYFLVFFLCFPAPLSAQTSADWYMAGANPDRTSHNSVEVPGNLQVNWYHVFDSFIDGKVQVIAAEGKVFVSSSKGLYAFDAVTGNKAWEYGTEMPLGNSPTYSNGYLYVGGFDHKLHAVKASDGTLKPGWTFNEASAGFDTNPVIANGRVFLGNRDGYMYSFDAANGQIKWKWRDEVDEWPDAPIRFSAAYKNGILYFGNDSSRAYAIQDNSTSATLVWRSPRLPGVGFTGYWPVIYTEPNNNTEYVIFSGSKKANWGWFGESWGTYPGYPVPSGQEFAANYTYFAENYQLASLGKNCTTNSCADISTYFTQNPHRRHFFAFNITTGTELTNPYPPVNWAGVTHGGNKFPPVVAGNGGLYTFVGYNICGGCNNGATGWLTKLTLGTSNISKIGNTSHNGAADEPESFTSGGNLIYFAEGVNAINFGTINVTNNTSYSWDPKSVSGVWARYTSPGGNDLTRKFGCGGNTPPCNGSYGYLDGQTNFSPIPYNGRLYMIFANSLVALNTSGGQINKGTVLAPPNQVPANIATNKTVVQQKLSHEVNKILNAKDPSNNVKPLRPGFMDSGILGGAYVGFYHINEDYEDIHGNHLGDYFSNPAETVITLAQAYPHLSTTEQNNVKTYLQNFYGPGKTYDFTNVVVSAWSKGLPREIYTDTPAMTLQINNETGNNFIATLNNWSSIRNPRNNSIPFTFKIANTYAPESFYAAWKYAQLFPTQATTIFDAVKSKLPTAGSSNDMSNANFKDFPYILNQYIAGYKGYIELAQMASQPADSSIVTEYNRLLNLRTDNFNKDVPWNNNFRYNHAFSVSRNFMHLAPELGSHLRANKLSQVQQAMNEYYGHEAYWFVSKYDRTYAEGIFQPLYSYPSLFQAKAYILQEPFSELVKYIDVPAFWRGDLFYIQNLVAALEAPGDITPPPASPTGIIPLTGDLDNDNDVDLLDLLKLLGVFSTSSPVFGDFNSNGRIDIFDVNTLIKNL